MQIEAGSPWKKCSRYSRDGHWCLSSFSAAVLVTGRHPHVFAE